MPHRPAARCGQKEHSCASVLVLGGILLSAAFIVVAGAFVVLFIYLRVRFLDVFVRIFQAAPLFIIPRGPIHSEVPKRSGFRERMALLYTAGI